MFEVALIHPEIPQNTGNIARLCVGLDVTLHLVKPFGFVLNDKHLKRAGLDYWEFLKLKIHESDTDFLSATQNQRLWLITTKATKNYTEADFKAKDLLVFGSETKGLPEMYHKNFPDTRLKIPMPGPVRSLNVSNAVACVGYEAFRQLS